jgi:hypothetical protein
VLHYIQKLYNIIYCFDCIWHTKNITMVVFLTVSVQIAIKTFTCDLSPTMKHVYSFIYFEIQDTPEIKKK